MVERLSLFPHNSYCIKKIFKSVERRYSPWLLKLTSCCILIFQVLIFQITYQLWRKGINLECFLPFVHKLHCGRVHSTSSCVIISWFRELWAHSEVKYIPLKRMSLTWYLNSTFLRVFCPENTEAYSTHLERGQTASTLFKWVACYCSFVKVDYHWSCYLVYLVQTWTANLCVCIESQVLSMLFRIKKLFFFFLWI